MIAHLQRASHTAGLLEYLYGPGERGSHTNPRLITGDGNGAPIEMLAQTDAPTYLAHALDAPVERLGTRAPERPVWVCSVRSDPRHPDPTDAQWAEVARRIVAATGIAPEGDPDACRWIAVRNQARQVHVVATLAREDGSLHNTYRDAFRLQTECHRIATELGHLPPAPHPTPRRPGDPRACSLHHHQRRAQRQRLGEGRQRRPVRHAPQARRFPADRGLVRPPPPPGDHHPAG